MQYPMPPYVNPEQFAAAIERRTAMINARNVYTALTKASTGVDLAALETRVEDDAEGCADDLVSDLVESWGHHGFALADLTEFKATEDQARERLLAIFTPREAIAWQSSERLGDEISDMLDLWQDAFDARVAFAQSSAEYAIGPMTARRWAEYVYA